MNEQIINLFGKLVKQIAYDIDIEQYKKKRTVNLFRLKQLNNAYEIIKKYPTKIKNGTELSEIKGIGKGIISRINEIIETGKLAELRSHEKELEQSEYVEKLKEIYGIGERKAYELVSTYGITSVADLKYAYYTGIIQLNKNVLMGLKYYGTYKQQIPREEMMRMEKYIINIAKTIDAKLEVKICGSFRRLKPFSNDIDCMLSHPNIKTDDDMQSKTNYLHLLIDALKDDMFIVDSLTGERVETKFMGFCQYTKKLPVRRIDIRYIPTEAYYSSLLYFTGSGPFNQRMRQFAKKEGYKLNEYGLYKINGKKYIKIDVSSEEDIFNKLGMDYVSPEKRI